MSYTLLFAYKDNENIIQNVSYKMYDAFSPDYPMSASEDYGTYAQIPGLCFVASL